MQNKLNKANLTYPNPLPKSNLLEKYKNIFALLAQLHKEGNFLSSWVPMSFSRALFHEVSY
jgi:hypothetical protein